MVNNKNFINPLTRSSEENLHIPNSSKELRPQTDIEQAPSNSKKYQTLKNRGNQAFEERHQRFTGWIDKNLKQRFEKLALEEGVSKTSLLNEALADLLRKHMQK